MTRISFTTITKPILAKFSHFNNDSLVLLHKDELVSYQLDKDFKKNKEVKHGIKDLDTKFTTAKIDHSGEIFILSDNRIYIFSDTHNFKNIGIYDKTKFDKETQERFTKFTGTLDFSDYKTITAMVTDTGYIFEIR